MSHELPCGPVNSADRYNAHRCRNDAPTLSQQQLTCRLSAYLANSLFVAVNPSGICDGIRAYISGLSFTRVTFLPIHKASQICLSCVCRGWVLQLELDFSLTFCSCLNMQPAFGAQKKKGGGKHWGKKTKIKFSALLT